MMHLLLIRCSFETTGVNFFPDPPSYILSIFSDELQGVVGEGYSIQVLIIFFRYLV